MRRAGFWKIQASSSVVGLDEVGLRDRREELLEPAVLVHALVRAGPRAELLAVVRVHDEARALVGSRAQLLHRLRSRRGTG